MIFDWSQHASRCLATESWNDNNLKIHELSSCTYTGQQLCQRIMSHCILMCHQVRACQLSVTLPTSKLLLSSISMITCCGWKPILKWHTDARDFSAFQGLSFILISISSQAFVMHRARAYLDICPIRLPQLSRKPHGLVQRRQDLFNTRHSCRKTFPRRLSRERLYFF